MDQGDAPSGERSEPSSAFAFGFALYCDGRAVVAGGVEGAEEESEVRKE